ncbi:EamA/RhaT family transporter [Flavobacterium akiainvivens]|nr:EamA/RhaT family transporter [Flavobacterium akiainvivens]
MARRHSISTGQVVGWNYVFALLLCYMFFDVTPQLYHFTDNWPIFVPLMFLLPSVFLMLALSIRHVGIVRTDAAQRMSLFIPILAALLIFHEAFNNYKIIGLCIAFPALALILSKKADKPAKEWLYPALVLLGFGLVDSLFKQVAIIKTPAYTTSLFILFSGALTITIGAVLYEIIFLKKKFQLMNFAYGMLVGIFNFGNILFYLKAHKAFSDNPSTVFAAMNIGVIVLGSLTGVLIFKEKLSLRNYAGIVLALVAIVFITLSQLK